MHELANISSATAASARLPISPSIAPELESMLNMIRGFTMHGKAEDSPRIFRKSEECVSTARSCSKLLKRASEPKRPASPTLLHEWIWSDDILTGQRRKVSEYRRDPFLAACLIGKINADSQCEQILNRLFQSIYKRR
jgi:hypothetical protein